MYLHSPVLEVGSWWRVDTASGTNTPTTVYAHDGADAIPTALGASGSTVRGNTRDGTGLFWSSTATLYCKKLTYQGVPTGTVVTSTGVTPTTPSGAPVDIATISTLVAALPTTYAPISATPIASSAASGTLTAAAEHNLTPTVAAAWTLPTGVAASKLPTTVKNNGTAAVTVARGGSDTINGGTASVSIAAGEWARFTSDGAGAWTQSGTAGQSGTYLTQSAAATTYAGKDHDIFYPESYGAIGDGTAHPLSGVYGTLGAAQAVYPFATALTDTLDQCGIQSAINAAVAAGAGVVQLAAKTYVVNGALRTAGNGYALLYIPALDVAGAQSANIEIRGVSSGTGFGSPTGDAAGGSNATIIKTTLTGQTLGTGSKIPCVIGGPSLETAQVFTAVDLTIRNLLVQCPTNPTLAGIDLAKVERVYIDGVNVNTVNAPSTQPTAIHAIGVRMPDVANYGVSRVGSLGVFGFYAAIIANTEHFNAADLTLKYNYGGLCLTGHNGWHGSTISKMQSEWQCYHIASWELSGLQQLPSSSPAIINIGLLDIEDAASGWYATAYHIIDDNNLLRGRIQYLRAVAAGSVGPTNGLLLRGATKVQFTDLFMPASNYGGAILAVTQYSVPSNVTTSSSTFADIDATNLKVTFTAPSSGNVIATLEAMCYAAGTSTYAWNLRDSGGDVTGTKRDMLYGTNNPDRLRASIYVTGLTPGTSYTWKWGHGLTFGSGSCAMSGNGSSEHALMTVTAA